MALLKHEAGGSVCLQPLFDGDSSKGRDKGEAEGLQHPMALGHLWIFSWPNWFSQELCAKGGAGECVGASSWQGMGCVDENMGEAAEGGS